jgi:hypothetical protein
MAQLFGENDFFLHRSVADNAFELLNLHRYGAVPLLCSATLHALAHQI